MQMNVIRMEFSPVLTMMESVVGSHIPNWKKINRR